MSIRSGLLLHCFRWFTSRQKLSFTRGTLRKQEIPNCYFGLCDYISCLLLSIGFLCEISSSAYLIHSIFNSLSITPNLYVTLSTLWIVIFHVLLVKFVYIFRSGVYLRSALWSFSMRSNVRNALPILSHRFWNEYWFLFFRIHRSILLVLEC